ncbi:MAG: cytochrome c3 family protein [Saprospiraceae bacterium]|nr:cytochrome c3 family protein [Saprospiraceae bacterium]
MPHNRILEKIAKFDHKLVNNPAINTCATCHKAPKDDIHTNYLDDCKICHSTIKWSPAKFEHSRYFQLDRDHNVKCNICHKSKSYKSYTCYGCHEHSREILPKSTEKKVSVISMIA